MLKLKSNDKASFYICKSKLAELLGPDIQLGAPDEIAGSRRRGRVASRRPGLAEKDQKGQNNGSSLHSRQFVEVSVRKVEIKAKNLDTGRVQS